MIKYFKLIILYIFCFLYSCDKHTVYIPDIYVSFSTPISDIPGIGQAIYVNNQGVKGVIIYQVDFNEYLAYDRACSYNPSEACEIIELNDILAPNFLVDSCCGSQFFITDGTPSQGPASIPLKQYQCWGDGSYVHVTN